MTKQVIICVDDETTVLKSLKAELKEALGKDYLIEIAESGEDALELIEELLEDNYEIPLIITDHIMPGMKGDELLKHTHRLSPETLKVMLTGQADLDAVASAINHANLYRYITKPWQAQDLRLTVKEAINSYLQTKKLAEQNAKLQKLNQEQAALIAKLHEKENRLKQFLDAMPVGVFVADASGKPYYINSRAQQLLGKGILPDASSEQLRQVYQVYREGSQQLYPKEEDILQRALRGEKASADDVEIHQGDQVIPVEVWGTPIYNNKGNQIYAIAAFQDITERKKAESDRQLLIEELFALNCNLEIALESESQLTEAARRFVPNEFLSLLGHKRLVEVELGEAVQREMSILFSDIRDFTTLSERMTPQENFEFINTYLSCMESAIAENQGFIDKYIGDAIMALFSGSADDAVKAGIAMLQSLADYNQHRMKSGHLPIEIGIGINTGLSMLGTVGGKNRMDGTVISDAVNLASRLENLTKMYGVPLLISHHTFFQLQDANQYAFRLIDRLKVKGKSEVVSVFEVFDAAPPIIKEAKLATKTTFEQALLLYNQGFWREAAQTFASVLSINPQDTVAQIYCDRCQSLATQMLPLP
ncbi:MAG TPA: adenylate/guanylate cyclase domain-containing protein [Coleofasciculaceae cyanobacterium]